MAILLLYGWNYLINAVYKDEWVLIIVYVCIVLIKYKRSEFEVWIALTDTIFDNIIFSGI